MRESNNFQTRTEKTEPRRSAWSFVNFDDCKKGETSAKTGCTPKSGAGGKKEGEGKEGTEGKSLDEATEDVTRAREKLDELRTAEGEASESLVKEAWDELKEAESARDSLQEEKWKKEEEGEGEEPQYEDLVDPKTGERPDLENMEFEGVVEYASQFPDMKEEIEGVKDYIESGMTDEEGASEQLIEMVDERLESLKDEAEERAEKGEGEKKEGEKEDSPSEGFVPRPELEKMNIDELTEYAEALPNITDDVENITEKQGDPDFPYDDAEDMLRDIVEDGIKAERSAIESGDLSAINDRITHLGEKLESDKGEMGSYDRERMGKELNELQEKREEIDQGIREKKEGEGDVGEGEKEREPGDLRNELPHEYDDNYYDEIKSTFDPQNWKDALKEVGDANRGGYTGEDTHTYSHLAGTMADALEAADNYEQNPNNSTMRSMLDKFEDVRKAQKEEKGHKENIVPREEHEAEQSRIHREHLEGRVEKAEKALDEGVGSEETEKKLDEASEALDNYERAEKRRKRESKKQERREKELEGLSPEDADELKKEWEGDERYAKRMAKRKRAGEKARKKRGEGGTSIPSPGDHM